MANQIQNLGFGMGEYGSEQADIERRRAYAQALQQQGAQPSGPTETVGGWAIKRSPLEGLAKALKQGIGAYQENQASEQQKALGQRYQSDLASTLMKAQAAGQGTPTIPSPADELGGGPGAPAQPGNRQEMARILMGHPGTQAMGQQQMLAGLAPPTRVDLGDKIGLVDAQGQIVGTLPKGATPDATLKEAGSDRRHAAPSGSAQLGAQTTLQTHATPSGGALLADQRTRAEGAANRGVTMRGQNMTDARATEAAQSGRIPPGYRTTADGGLEATPGGPADEKEAKKTGEVKKAVDMYVAARDGLLTGLEGSTTGPAMGRMPAVTTGQQVAEGGVAAMAPVLKQLFRVSGEGVFTDRDQALLLDMVPKRTDQPEARAEKMANIDRIVAAKLGQPVPQRANSGGGQATKIAGDAEYNLLPKGARYVGPDGVERTK